MSHAGHAVFLSYASQDAEAAKRICVALRAAGVEVWFDQSELVGGDAWDRKIRGQIASCALFLPVISVATQARREGYFRLEWKLAAQRTHMISERTAFLLPLVIDATRDAEADVPDEFRAVQWTRLPGGETTGAFGERVKTLLAGSAELEAGSPRPSPRDEGFAPQKKPQPARTQLVPVVVVLAALAVIVLALWRPWHIPPEPTKSAPTLSSPAAQPPLDFASAKSIAVLPFVNLSSDKANEYLSDGITEEILNTLTKVPGLRVPARTSSFVFKGKTDDIKKIGERLRVATVLEGSVQKSGNQLRVTAQLINVADGYHLWSEKYDREMTNIFDIQDDIARTIVAKLRITLTGSTGLPGAKPRTENVEAYALYLKGRFHAEKFTALELRQAITHFQQALIRQPDYARAYAGLGFAYGNLRYFAYVPPESVTAQWRAAVAKALELDDTLAEAHTSLAAQYFYVDRNWGAAEREFKRALELDSAYVYAHSVYAYLLAVMGRHPEALVEAAKAQQLDPLSVNQLVNLGWTSFFARDYDRALEAGRQAVAMAPEFFLSHELTAFALWKKGESEAGIAQMEKVARMAPVPEVLGHLGFLHGRVGRKADAQKVLDQFLVRAKQEYVPAMAIANVYVGLGDFEQANIWMNQAITAREGSVVYLKVTADDIIRANPYYVEWLKKIGLEK